MAPLSPAQRARLHRHAEPTRRSKMISGRMLLMYVRSSHQPRSFDDVVEVIRRNSFGILVSASASAVVASHLPFVYAPAPGRHGTLYAHMARANEHAALLEGTAEAMVIFTGPHAYISPSWYDDRATA